MPEEPVKVEKYGAVVYSDQEMDELRRERCLCLRCGEIRGCLMAKALLASCKEWDLALAVTRCPKWSPKVTT